MNECSNTVGGSRLDLSSASRPDGALSSWRRRRALGRLASGLSRCWADGDIPWFRDISIQARFNLLIGVVLAAGLLVGGAYMVGERRIAAAIADEDGFQRIGELASTLRTGALSMQASANGLIDEREARFIGGFDDDLVRVAAALSAVRDNPMALTHKAQLEALAGSLSAVDAQFKTVARETRALGLSENEGLRQKLAASVKSIETELALWPNSDDLKARLLRMRQAEKDFMLYQDNAYLGKHRKYAMEFDLGIDSAGIAASTKDSFRSLATQYAGDMAAYGQAYLDQQKDIGQLRGMFAQLQPQMAVFADLARAGMADATRRQSEIRHQMGRLTAVMGITAMLAVLLVGLISGRSIARPVLAMEIAMNRLAGGENSIEIPGTHRADEVGLMAKAVRVFRDNALAMQTLQLREKAEQAAKELRLRKRENIIAGFDADVSGIIGSVSSSAVAAESTVREMDSFVVDTLEEMQAVDRSSAAANANVQAMAAASEQLACSVSEISTRVHAASELAGRAAEAAHKTDGIVQTLFNATRQIDGVVNFIEKIAAQTRLLALNATIEAGRAGAHGQGFNVVAREVKDLAGQTAGATKEIAAQVAAVQLAGAEAVTAIREISAAVGEVNGISTAIAAAVEQQGAATREIARSAQEAAQGSGMVAIAISHVVGGAAEMRGKVDNMLGSSQELRLQSEVLRTVVDNFLLGVSDGELTLKWGDNWLTGHPVIDADHRKLVAYVNDLSSAMTRGKGREVVGPLLEKLAAYTVEHFTREEVIWAEGGLSILAQHRRSHADLADKVRRFQADFMAGQEALSMEMMAFLRDWLIHHVFKTDKPAMRLLSSRPAAGEA